MADALASLDATAQAELVRSGEVTPAELVDAAIARIERLDPELNAVIHRLFDKARATASSAQLSDGPFRGVPFLVKDAVCHTAGDPYHLGMRVLKQRQYVASSDTELARRLRAAGFVFVGRTNTPELAMSTTTEPLAYGASHNPWDPAHSPGGSSGGSAAAVAAGLVPVAHGNDMGGSIRLPASHCGLVGLKPTRARGTLAPHLSEYWGPLTHEHVLTRSVRDSAAVLDAIAGASPGDPYTAPPPLRPWSREIGADPGVLRVGFIVDSAQCEVDSECASAVERTAGWLGEFGHRVEPIAIPALGRTESGPWIPVGLARDLELWSQRLGRPIGPDDVEPLNWLLAESGRAMTATQYAASADDAWAWAREVARPWSHEIDVLLTPTAPIAPPKLGWLAPRVAIPDLLARLGQATVFTMPFDVTGQPAISLPLHQSSQGLPLGVQLVADSGREDLLFRLASQLEAARPWSGRRPAIHA